MSETKFEQDLKAYFPEIYRIHTAGKWDKLIWEVFNSMMEFMEKGEFGEVTIKYQKGRINQILKMIQVTAGKDQSPNLTAPNYLNRE